MSDTPAPVIVGKIGAPFGVRGWVSVNSYTDPRHNILNYTDHLLIAEKSGWKQLAVIDCKAQSKKIVMQLKDCDDRDAAALLTGRELAIAKQNLPQSNDSGTYWHDLVGCQVINTQQQNLGTIDHLFETGANDVIVTTGERERLIPFTAITATDLPNKTITVEWDADF